MSDYREEIAAIDKQLEQDSDELPTLLAEKAALQRMILAQADQTESKTMLSAKSIFLIIALVFGTTSGLLYHQLGSPYLAGKQIADKSDLDGLPLDQLVVRLEKTLKADPANPNGWILYARSLMTMGRYDDALAAYDQALSLTNSDEKVVTERTSAVRYIDQIKAGQPGPTSDDVKAAMELSAKDRAAMVQQMVDGLSAKLEENPNDETGWIRLLKARYVLGQGEMAAQEIERMREAYAGQPETIERILTAAGQGIP
ncbi:MAG: tetratricopeptide repeat protein [Hyphomonadaceae bacterium]|nr:tetratricopeptide repeat protein [Hyphomonadaceae bacterium]